MSKSLLEMLDKYPMIKESALKEFSKKSFNEASLNTILKDANMSKGSFYHNFEDKNCLYYAIVDYFVKLKEDIFYELKKSATLEVDFFDKLIILAKANRRLLSYPYIEGFYKNFINESASFHEKIYKRKPLTEVTYFIEEFNLAFEKGEFNDKYDKDMIFRYISGFFNTLVNLIEKEDDFDKSIRKIEIFINMLRDVIGSKKEING